jgi:hypothetical protein
LSTPSQLSLGGTQAPVPQVSVHVEVPADPHVVVHGVTLPGRQPDSPPHVPIGTKRHVVSQTVRCVPQRPHAPIAVVPGAHSPSPTHGPFTQRRVASHVRSRVPQLPQLTVSNAPGTHSSISQGPGTNVHASPHTSARDCPMPQPASVRIVSPGVHIPSPVHVADTDHVQDTEQRASAVPQRPQGRASVVPGAHSPSPLHAP